MKQILLIALALATVGMIATGCSSSGGDEAAPPIKDAPKGDDSTPSADGNSGGQAAETPQVSND